MSTTTATALSRVYDSVLTLVYPQACAVCGRSVESRHEGVACSACWNATRLFNESDGLCWKCGELTATAVPEIKRQTVRCGRCQDDHFSAARACGLYEGALRASVLALKRDPHVSRRLIEAIIAAAKLAPVNEADLVVPVPLHPQRERERGHNQAAVLARELARAANLEIDEYNLARRVHTERHRAGMDSRARRESVAEAFEVRAPKVVFGRRVLLVDDVFTTGATVSECARALKSAGAVDVYVLTVARA